eukprot:CAMPEP_0174837872 /NCGR_PEP_ID=MMETSP1114-20130205/7029_1 /TAXON_ID=312471 /ORGANISM="Neobodo designis, Strain CCAP 1951/1" /LENGTH=410 /DNA_ID=CAMNT_0016071957 /DNA_START=90 /DNA_END=1322 /DNA_ORIENTATION=+
MSEPTDLKVDTHGPALDADVRSGSFSSAAPSTPFTPRDLPWGANAVSPRDRLDSSPRAAHRTSSMRSFTTARTVPTPGGRSHAATVVIEPVAMTRVATAPVVGKAQSVCSNRSFRTARSTRSAAGDVSHQAPHRTLRTGMTSSAAEPDGGVCVSMSPKGERSQLPSSPGEVRDSLMSGKGSPRSRDAALVLTGRSTPSRLEVLAAVVGVGLLAGTLVLVALALLSTAPADAAGSPDHDDARPPVLAFAAACAVASAASLFVFAVLYKKRRHADRLARKRATASNGIVTSPRHGVGYAPVADAAVLSAAALRTLEQCGPPSAAHDRTLEGADTLAAMQSSVRSLHASLGNSAAPPSHDDALDVHTELFDLDPDGDRAANDRALEAADSLAATQSSVLSLHTPWPGEAEYPC